MAANTGQGRGFTTFLVGLVLACVGIAYFSSGFGKPLFAVGLVIFVVSLFGFLKIKPLEGKPAESTSPTVMKLVGVILSLFGWGITLFGVHMTDGNAGRMVLALVGIGVSLIGIVFVLPSAFNKNAIWKA
jgi:predicted acyltransferase